MKNFIDRSIAFSVLIISSPLLFVLYIMVRVNLGNPAFFIQERVGKHGKTFNMYKFRTMTDARDDKGELLLDEQRITALGSFLRSSSLDELPELWNVLRGDMSLVGPRPLLVEYLPLYNEFQQRRHEVKPGLTGWAQVNGRNHLTWDERFQMDVWYVDHQTFFIDLKIIIMTIFKVLNREGVQTEQDTTMPRFKGSVTSKGNADA